MSMKWADSKNDTLRELWAANHPTRVIASLMDITKNAVVGQAHRLDLPGRLSPIKRWEGYGPPPPPCRVLRPKKVRPPALVYPEGIALERAAIKEQQRLLKASIVAVPRALTVAPRERPTRAIRAPEVTLAEVRYEAPVKLVAPRYGRVVECSWPSGTPGKADFRYCDEPSEPSKSYCLPHCQMAYSSMRPRAGQIMAEPQRRGNATQLIDGDDAD